MNKELFEKIEYLRANATIGYEEAASLLERYDGDLARAMIELERAHRLNDSKAKAKESAWDNVFTRGKDEARKHYNNYNNNPDNWFSKLMRTKVQVTRDGNNVAEVPVVVPIVTTLFAPYLTVAGAIVGGLAGFRVSSTSENEQDGGSEG